MDDYQKYLDLLNLKPGATPDQVKKAYTQLAHVWHPDRFGHNPILRLKAEETMKEINIARDKLLSLTSESLKNIQKTSPDTSPGKTQWVPEFYAESPSWWDGLPIAKEKVVLWVRRAAWIFAGILVLRFIIHLFRKN